MFYTANIQVDNAKVSPKHKNKWFEDKNGRFKSSFGCRFLIEDNESENVNKTQLNLISKCPEICYKDNRCTHFIYSQGVCYLKEFKLTDASPDVAIYDNPGGLCGFLVERPVQCYYSIPIFY